MEEQDRVHPVPEGENGPEDMAAALRQENEELRRQVEEAARLREQQRRQQTNEAVRQALIRHGAHPDAAGLLVRECGDPALDDRGGLTDEEAVIAPVRAAWPGLFITREAVGTPTVAPPLSGSGITEDRLRSMPPEEINRHWDLIREQLNRQ